MEDLLQKFKNIQIFPFIEEQLAAVEFNAFQERLEEEGFIVVRFREKPLSSKEEIMEEFDYAFNFPWYFGKNWDAVDDCLSDLSWMPGKGYLMVISMYPKVNLKDFYLFLDVIRTASRTWASKGIPFKIMVPPFQIV